MMKIIKSLRQAEEIHIHSAGFAELSAAANGMQVRCGSILMPKWARCLPGKPYSFHEEIARHGDYILDRLKHRAEARNPKLVDASHTRRTWFRGFDRIDCGPTPKAVKPVVTFKFFRWHVHIYN